MDESDNGTTRKRERSTRYPGDTLAECVEFARFLGSKGLVGLAATDIALALGFKSVKTNTFSARLSAARQFGLVVQENDGISLTPLAKSILHPVDPNELPALHRQALLQPPLYAELAHRLESKVVPEAAILANVLYHQHQISASAKDAAAGVFLESARFAGALGEDGIFRPRREEPPAKPMPVPVPDRKENPPAAPHAVRLDLRLWDRDEGKTIRLRAPESISAESFERFLQAFRLLVKIEGAKE